MKLRTKDSFVDVTVDSATTEVQAQLSCKTRAVILSENRRHVSYWIEVNKLPWAEETDKSHFQVVQEALVIFGSLRNLWVQYLSLISQKILLILKHKGPKGFLNMLQYILRLYPKVLLLQPLHHLNWSHQRNSKTRFVQLAVIPAEQILCWSGKFMTLDDQFTHKQST